MRLADEDERIEIYVETFLSAISAFICSAINAIDSIVVLSS